MKLSVKYLPQGVKESNILNIGIEINEHETEQAMKRAGKLINRLKKRER